jgi:hypothetical protein
MSSTLKLNSEPLEYTLEFLAKNKNAAVIPLAWPEMTARGQEKLWEVLRKIGIVKNINFKVGHAAMVVALDTEFLYYDFGRYITPMGYGRTRSAETDPKLSLYTKPKWSDEGRLTNLEELCGELESIKHATHGDGPMFASINHETNPFRLFEYIHSIINHGYIKYNALIRSHSNCARFVAQAIQAGWDKKSHFRRRFIIPVTLAPTPYFNVLAASENGKYIIWEKGKGTFFKNKIRHSLKELLSKSYESFTSKSAKILPSDALPGQYYPPKSKPENLSDHVLFLGGIGEAAWHEVEIFDEDKLKMTRFFSTGEFEFEAEYDVSKEWIKKINDSSCQLVHDTHHCWITFQCTVTGEKRRFHRKPASK